MENEVRVLTIDDEIFIRQNIAAYLEDSGYIVDEAENGRVGLEHFRKIKPDVILVDLHMPEVDGFEVLRQVKQESPETPTIVISGTGAIQTAVEAIRLGAWDFVQKPILDMSVLEVTLDRVLERVALIEENKRYREHLEDEIQIRTQKLKERTNELEDLNNQLISEISQRKEAEKKLGELNAELETRVSQRTAELEESLERLHSTQAQLIQQEKMASLGGLTAGFAHEINTPLGLGITVSSHIKDQTDRIDLDLEEGILDRDELQEYLNNVRKSTDMLSDNLNRAADFIAHFKEISVDQSIEEAREFKVKDYIDQILDSLHSKFRKNEKIIVQCDEDIVFYSYPGAFFQIISNFIMNSLQHGFDAESPREINIEIEQKEEELFMTYRDNGRGIPTDVLPKIFDPFFTTKRGQGGTGLGLHIIYNLITQKLKGEIQCDGKIEKGVKFTVQLPVLTDF